MKTHRLISRLPGKMGRLAIAGGSVLLLGACSAILGLTDPSQNDSIGGGNGEGGSGDGAIGSGDGGGSDGAGGDAASCAGIDVSHDKLNCGACGHSCLGGECQSSKCQPVLVASGAYAFDIALDDTNVYWANYPDGNIGSCPLAGCPNPSTPTILTTGTLNGATAIALDGAGHIYWAEAGDPSAGNGNVGTCTIASCASGQTNVKSSLKYPNDLAIANGSLYILTEGTSGANYDDGAISACTLPCSVFTTIAVNQSEPYDLAVTSSEIFWTYSDDDSSKYGWGRAPLSGVNVELFPNDNPSGIAVTSDSVLWTEFTRGTIQADPLAGPGVDGGTQLVQDLHEPIHMLVDGTSMYIVDQGTNPSGGSSDGQVIRCPVTGCATHEVLADAQGWPHAVAVNSNAIYWGNFDVPGNIYMLAK